MATDYSGWTDRDTANYTAAQKRAQANARDGGTLGAGGYRAPTSPSPRVPVSWRGDGDPRPKLGVGGYKGPSWYTGPGSTSDTGWLNQSQQDLMNSYREAIPGEETFDSVEGYIYASYPYMLAFLNNPEVGPLLRQGARENWSPGKLYGAVTATSWWRETSAAERTWQALQAEDPAEASRLATEKIPALRDQARALGLNMSADQYANIALQAAKFGWDDAQVLDEVLKAVNWSTLKAGQITAYRDTVTELGSNYLVDVSDQTAQNYALAIASNEMTMAGAESAMREQARIRFSWMGDAIDQGVTPMQYLSPVRDRIAAELGLTPNAVNLQDPKWLSMVETRDESGEIRGATLDEATKAARRDPRWAETENARELATRAGSMLRQAFGR